MKKIKAMIAGLPGKMATLVAEHVEKAEDMEFEPFVLSEEAGEMQIGRSKVYQIALDWHKEGIMKRLSSIDIIVDFTLPESVNRNAELYCKCGIPFVMGTTGGDRGQLRNVVEESNISAVIAPNMAKQIVAFQAMMKYAAENFPGVFKEYNLKIVESHQKGKADTSGTAKAMVEYFNMLGIPFKKEQITMIREPQRQSAMKIPKGYLTGHGWHTYILESKDGTVLFRFTHNANGRDVYAQGTLDAIRFLFEKKGERGKVFSMIDVLRAKKKE